MITFLKNVGNSLFLRIICTKRSKIHAAVHGQDIININNVIDYYYKHSDKINDVLLSLTYYDDDKEIKDYMEESDSGMISEKEMEEIEESEGGSEEESEENSEEQEVEFKCPKCGCDNALIDKDGNVYPCYSCLTIEIGNKILNKYNYKLFEKIDTLNTDIQKVLEDKEGDKKNGTKD